MEGVPPAWTGQEVVNSFDHQLSRKKLGGDRQSMKDRSSLVQKTENVKSSNWATVFMQFGLERALGVHGIQLRPA